LIRDIGLLRCNKISTPGTRAQVTRAKWQFLFFEIFAQLAKLDSAADHHSTGMASSAGRRSLAHHDKAGRLSAARLPPKLFDRQPHFDKHQLVPRLRNLGGGVLVAHAIFSPLQKREGTDRRAPLPLCSGHWLAFPSHPGPFVLVPVSVNAYYHVNKRQRLFGGGMKDFPTSQRPAKTSRMGRPPLNVKVTAVRLTVEMMARIEAVAGKHRMSQFLREAAEAELLRREASAASHDKPKPTKSAPGGPDKPKKKKPKG
jgi:hypothetical protein